MKPADAPLRTRKQRIHRFSPEALQNLFAFLLAAAFFLVFCAYLRIVPFGDKTFLYHDMKRQYIDFYAYYQTVFTGSNDLLYSFSRGLGDEMTGFAAYYLTSPFLLPLVFVPRAALPAAVTFMLLGKLSFAALTCNVFLQKYFGRPSLLSVPFSVSFAFSAYFIANIINPMWLDAVILMPLLLLCAFRIERGGSALPCALCTAAALFVNYYIAYMILLFLVVWMLLRLLLYRHPLRHFLRFLGAVLSGALLDAFLLLPAFLSLTDSDKLSVRPVEALPLVTRIFFNQLCRVLAHLFLFSFDETQVKEGFPQLACGILIPLLALCGLCNHRVSRRERTEYLLLFLFLLFSFCSPLLNLIWHADAEPSGYLYRYAFLFTFLMIVCAYKAFSSMLRSEMSARTFFTGCCLFLLFSIVLLLGRYSCLGAGGRLRNILLIAADVLLLTLVYCFRRSGTRARLRASGVCILLLLLLQGVNLATNAGLIYLKSSFLQIGASEFKEITDRIARTVDAARKNDPSFYRIASYSMRSENDSLQFDYPGVTHYSSGDDLRNRLFLQSLGFLHTGLYASYDDQNTVSADALLGVRYYLLEETAKENRDALPMAIGFPAPPPSLSSSFAYGDPFSRISGIFHALTGTAVSPLFPADILSEDTAVFAQAGTVSRKYLLRVAHTGSLYCYFANLKNTEQNMELFCNGASCGYYGNAPSIRVLRCGTFSEGDVISMELVAYDTAPELADFGRACFVTEDLSILHDITNQLSSLALDVRKCSSSHLRISLPADIRTLILLVPFDAGWHIACTPYDGAVSITPAFGFYMNLSLPAPDGEALLSAPQEKTLDLYYIPPGLVPGILISLLTLLLLSSLHAARRFRL